MIPTIPWLKEMFNLFNEKYFGDKIPMPTFSLDCPEGNWGYYKPNGTYSKITREVEPYSSGTLYITNKFSRDEKDIQNTLIHEMIHMYIILVNKKYPFNQHGSMFQNWADKLNAQGWEISEANEIKDTDIEADGEETVQNNEQNLNQFLICVLEKPNGQNYKYWCFMPNPKTINNYVQIVRNMKQKGVTMLKIFYYYSPNKPNLPIATNQLEGFGSMDYQSMMNKLSSLVNNKITDENFKLVNTINI